MLTLFDFLYKHREPGLFRRLPIYIFNIRRKRAPPHERIEFNMDQTSMACATSATNTPKTNGISLLFASLDTLADGLFLLDSNDCIAYTNHQATRLTGLRQCDLQGNQVSDIFTEPALAALIIQTRHTQCSNHIEIDTTNHERRYEYRCLPSSEGLLLFVRDVTASRQRGNHRTEAGKQHEQLLEAQAVAITLSEANRQMDDFIGIVSHELRTPLTTVKANIQLAQRQLTRLSRESTHLESEQQARIVQIQSNLERAERQANRQNRLVGDLLDVSRIHSKRLELALTPCDLAVIINEIVEEQRQMIPTRSISLESACQAAPILADRDRIEQVIHNYLSNALKYSEEETPVRVRLLCEEGCYRVEVIDQGPGLTLEQQEHIWERFYRVEGIEIKSGNGVGLGLGLHICVSLIEHHQGQAGVISVPGKGSTFWFTLPRDKEIQPSPTTI